MLSERAKFLGLTDKDYRIFPLICDDGLVFIESLYSIPGGQFKNAVRELYDIIKDLDTRARLLYVLNDEKNSVYQVLIATTNSEELGLGSRLKDLIGREGQEIDIELIVVLPSPEEDSSTYNHFIYLAAAVGIMGKKNYSE